MVEMGGIAPPSDRPTGTRRYKLGPFKGLDRASGSGQTRAVKAFQPWSRLEGDGGI